MSKSKGKSQKKKRTGQHHLAAFKLRGQRKAVLEQQQACEFYEDVQRGAVIVGDVTYVQRSWLAEHGEELAEELGYAEVDDAVEAMEKEGLLHVYEDTELSGEIERARAKLAELSAGLQRLP